MALSLTVMTELDLLIQLPCRLIVPTNLETKDLPGEADLHIETDSIAASKESERTTIQIVQKIPDDSKFTMKMSLAITIAVNEILIGTLTDRYPGLDMMIMIGIRKNEHVREAVHHIEQAGVPRKGKTNPAIATRHVGMEAVVVIQSLPEIEDWVKTMEEAWR